jgi:uroporphyrinogen-III synthase
MSGARDDAGTTRSAAANASDAGSAATPAAQLVAPLAGIRVVVTRPGRQAAIFAQRLAIIGGEPIVCPAMVIAPPANPAPFSAVLRHLGDFDFALFVSANAAEAVLTQDVAWPSRLTAIAVGPTTADALILGGIADELSPPARFDSEGVLALPALQNVKGKRIVIFRGESDGGSKGRELMRETLDARGAIVEPVACYRRQRPTFNADGLLDQWRSGGVDAVIATSVEVLDNFLALIGDTGRGLLAATPLFVPHERIAAHAKNKGLTNIVTTAATDAGLIAGLLTYFQRT